MSSKGSGTQGFRYYMSLLSGLCRGPIDELVEIKAGEKQAWSGHACNSQPQRIDAANLFGGDDKEGGIQGSFALFTGAEGQVLPGAQGDLPDVRATIGGLVSQMRGVACVWFDGMVSAMNPYLKTWAFRVRRSQKGWYGGSVWYQDKATIFLGSDNFAVTTGQTNAFPIVTNEDATITIKLTRNMQEGDTFNINGYTITVVADQKDSKLAEGEFDPDDDTARTARKFANYINARSTTYKAVATYTNNSVTLTADKSGQQIYAMNPAHIIYQCMTDPLWGRGHDTSDILESSFVVAANTFCSEGFGLALTWYRKEDIDDFIQKICDLAGAVTYTDRETGKQAIKLIRNDYDINEVPLFTPETGLLAITDDDSASSDNAFNEIIGKSRDPISNLEFEMRAQNLASRQAQGSPSSLDQDYTGIPTKQLLARVLLRDLRAMGSGLKKYNIVLDRRAWRITPGSVIRISHPKRGISNLVLRVGEIDDSNMVSGEIRMKAAVDVFGLPATSYMDVVDSGWIAPSRVAVPPPQERLIEPGYRDIYRMVGAEEAKAIDATTAYIGQLASAPNETSLEYDLLTKAEGEGEYGDNARGPFTGYGVLETPLAPLDTQASLREAVMLDAGNVGQALFIGDELVRLDGVMDGGLTLAITRGVADTVPQAHDAGALLWTIDDDLVSDRIAYAAGETVFAKVLTRTSSDLLKPEEADEQSIELVGRAARPYPPADVRIGGISIYQDVGFQPEPVLTWAERNRVTLADKMLGHTDGTIAPEIGQTNTIRVYALDGTTLLREAVGVEGTTWTYEDAAQIEDGSPSVVVFELSSSRDDLESWQKYRARVILNGGVITVDGDPITIDGDTIEVN